MIFKIFTAISVPKETCWYKIYLLGITGDTKLARRNPSAFNCRMCSHRTIELPLPLYPGQPAPELDNPYHKEIFPTIQPKPPWHKLRPFPCVLSLVIWEQRQTCSQPAFRELQRVTGSRRASLFSRIKIPPPSAAPHKTWPPDPLVIPLSVQFRLSWTHCSNSA